MVRTCAGYPAALDPTAAMIESSFLIHLGTMMRMMVIMIMMILMQGIIKSV